MAGSQLRPSLLLMVEATAALPGQPVASAEHPFEADTRVQALAEGGYSAQISDRWGNLVGAPNGGYLLSVCVRALLNDVAFPDPLVLSAFFLRPARVGPAELQCELVRSGRRLATAEARMVQEGKEIVRLVGSFCDLSAASGPTLVLNEPPTLPDPSEAIDPLAGTSAPGVTIADRVEYRMPKLPGWWQGKPTGEPAMAIWARFREPRDPEPISLPLFVDAAAPAILELGEQASYTLEMTVHLRARPAPGWLACRIATRHLIDGYHEEDFEIWDSAGKLVAQSRQLGLVVSPSRSAA